MIIHCWTSSRKIYEPSVFSFYSFETRSKGQTFKRSKGQKVKRSKGPNGHKAKCQKVKRSKDQGVERLKGPKGSMGQDYTPKMGMLAKN